MKRFLAFCLILAVVALPATAACPKSNPNVYNKIFPMNPEDAPELPRIPHTFGGCVYIGDNPAPAGTVVCIEGDGVAKNCVETNAAGCFGIGIFDQRLIATGIPFPGRGMINVKEGTDLSFYVNGEKARVCVGDFCSWTVQYHSGHHTNVMLYAVGQPDSTYCCP